MGSTDTAGDWAVFFLIWAGCCAMWVILAKRVSRKYRSDLYRPGNAKPEAFVRQAPLMGRIGKACLLIGVAFLLVDGVRRLV